MRELKFMIEGMMCEGCENRVKNALMEVIGVTKVNADHVTGELIVETNCDNKKQIEEAIQDLGYEIVGG